MKKGLLIASLLISLSVLIVLGALEDAAAKEKVYTLKFQTLYSEGQNVFESIKFFTGEIEKRTHGRVKFQVFPGSSLVPTRQMVSATNSGVLDACYVPPPYEQGLWPITGITGIYGAPKVTYKQWRTVHDQVRDITNKEIDINVVVVSMPHILNYLLYSRNPLTGKPEDFNGMLIRSAGGPFNAAVKALGGAPVKIPAPEVYMALQKGTIDGGLNVYSRYVEGKLYEVAPYVVVLPKGFAISAQHYIVNKQVWNSLPADIQKIFFEVGAEVVSFLNDRSAASDKKILAETLPKLGIKPIVMSEEENQILLQKLKPVWEQYIAKLGEPAAEIARIIGVK